MTHADDFRNELYRMMLEAMKAGEAFAEINAGELHRRMGDYPGKNHRLPICCEVMRGALAPVILEQPPSGPWMRNCVPAWKSSLLVTEPSLSGVSWRRGAAGNPKHK